MDNHILWVTLSIVLLVATYVLVLTSKGEFERVRNSWRRCDWMIFLSAIFGGVLLSSAMRESGMRISNEPWLFITPILIITALVLIALVRKVMTGRPITQILGDERLELIYAKSGRNAFFTTYLVLFIHLLITDAGTMDAKWLLIMLASGLIMLTASLFFYYYRKS